MKFRLAVSGWLRDEAAFTAVEYALLVALIAAATIASLRLLGTNIDGVFATVRAHL
ncbi:MAG: Flp family type IVb pilin [Ferrovum sp.]|nr:Flp family type IVb pilin [Ferrovum sp.]